MKPLRKLGLLVVLSAIAIWAGDTLAQVTGTIPNYPYIPYLCTGNWQCTGKWSGCTVDTGGIPQCVWTGVHPNTCVFDDPTYGCQYFGG